jgi:hypothetical protein
MALTKVNNRMIDNAAANVLDFGADNTGVADSTTAIQAALDSGAKTVYLSSGTYLVSGQLTVPANVSLIGEGMTVTTITAEGNTTGTFADNAVVYKGGTQPTAIPDLASNVSKADDTLTFVSAHGLSVGDAILIYNPTDASWHSNRPVYRAGEYCEIAEVISSTEVALKAGLFDDYTAADVEVYVCSGYGSGTLSGFKSIAPGAGAKSIVQAIAVEFCRKFELKSLEATNSDNASMSITKCFQGIAHDLRCFQWGANPGFGTQYGLVIGNTQELDVTGDFAGQRHAIAIGGGADFSVSNRHVHCHDITAKSESGSIASLDWHGNVEWCSYVNCKISGGGLNIAGNNNRICNIDAIGNNMMLVLGREILGCDHVMENVKCYTGRNDTNRSIINIGGNENPMTATNTRYGGKYIFRNIEIVAPNATSSSGIGIRNRGFTAEDWDVLVDNLVYDAPSITDANGGVSTDTVSGDPPTRVQATNITVSDSVPLKLRGVASTTLVRQDGLSGLVEWDFDAADTSATVAVTFAKQFAKTPAVICAPNIPTPGAGLLIAYARNVDPDEFDAELYMTDNSAFGTTRTDWPGSWQATLWEW